MKPIRSIEDWVTDLDQGTGEAPEKAEAALAEALSSQVEALREKAAAVLMARLQTASSSLALRLLTLLQAFLWEVRLELAQELARAALGALERLEAEEWEEGGEQAALLLSRAVQVDPSVLPRVQEALGSGAAAVRLAAIGAVLRMSAPSPELLEAASALAQDVEPKVALGAVEALGAHLATFSKGLLAPLVKAARSTEAEVKRSALGALRHWALQAAGEDERVALRALAELVPTLCEGVADAHAGVRLESAGLLGLVGGKGAEAALLGGLADAEPEVSALAASGLVRLGAKLEEAGAHLARLLGSKDGDQVAAAYSALDELGPKEAGALRPWLDPLAKADPQAAELLKELGSRP
jgi:hypothetical protein